jgi:surface antigen
MDDVKAANLAADMALAADLSVANSVFSQSISMSASADLGQYNATTISKTDAVDTMSMSVLGTYKVVEGDTASSIAKKFGISAQTVRWANDLTGNDVAVGSSVVVPVVDGVVYTVRSGDDLKEIASKYKSDVNNILAVNDLADHSVKANTKILLPEGVLPNNERPGQSVLGNNNNSNNGSSGVAWTGMASYAGNRYSYGYCTWYAYNRRAQIGRPIPSNLGNACTWAANAQSWGYLVNNKPSVGAVMQNRNRGCPGHVAVVEKINPNGSIIISEMNYHSGTDIYGKLTGWGRISHRIVHNPQDYNFIH